jgi:hypothetical protein
MPDEHQKERPMGGQWAEQQKKGMQKQQKQQSSESHRPLSDEEQRKLEEDVVRETEQESSGDERTPDKTIGQIAYADGQKQQPGGAGEPQASKMEPEKQRGIGGP